MTRKPKTLKEGILGGILNCRIPTPASDTPAGELPLVRLRGEGKRMHTPSEELFCSLWLVIKQGGRYFVLYSTTEEGFNSHLPLHAISSILGSVSHAPSNRNENNLSRSEFNVIFSPAPYNRNNNSYQDQNKTSYQRHIPSNRNNNSSYQDQIFSPSMMNLKETACAHSRNCCDQCQHRSQSNSGIDEQNSKIDSTASSPSEAVGSDIQTRPTSNRLSKAMSRAAALLAQKLNNKGVRLISAGRYEKAISYFLNAMEIAEQDKQEACLCEHCSLASCVDYSTEKPLCSTAVLMPTQNEGYMHEYGILARPESRGHSMGSVLKLIITLNLALSRHLRWIQRNDHEDIQSLQNVANLYHLSFRWCMAEDADVGLPFGFVLIILNNLCEIHRQANNRRKLESCALQLQSTLMASALSSERRYACKQTRLAGFYRNAFSTTTGAAVA
eukprot:scaffold1060_cov109-Cylindrotheca_fusiformis.AAC.6